MIGAAATALSGCKTLETPGDDATIRSQLIAKVNHFPSSKSKQVSLALLRNGSTYFYVDENGLPAARWRGEDDLGSCVHIRPDTGLPYLENQFPLSLRDGKAPKYIQFGHEGAWYSRRHNGLDKALGTEKNWIDDNSERDGQALLDLLIPALGA